MNSTQINANAGPASSNEANAAKAIRWIDEKAAMATNSVTARNISAPTGGIDKTRSANASYSAVADREWGA